MMQLRNLILTTLILTTLILTSQVSKADSNWQKTDDGDLGFQFGVGVPTLDVNFLDESSSSNPSLRKLNYKPNVRSRSFVRVSYGSFALSASGSSGNTNLESAKYGVSETQDFRFRFFGAKWTPELFYQHYSGYYLENSENVISNFTDSSNRYLRPDMSLIHYGANLIYNFNSDTYHPAGTFGLDVFQKKSGGAWLGFMTYDHNDLKADSPFVPASLQSYYVDLNKVKRVSVKTLSAGLGGAYSLTYGNFVAGGLLGLGLGTQQTRLEGELGNDNLSTGSARSYVKFGLGYNAEHFHSGFMYNGENVSSQFGKSKVEFVSAEVQLYLGWRFSDVHLTWLEQLEAKIFKN